MAVVFVAWVVLTLAWAPAPGSEVKHLKLLLYGGLSFLLLLGSIGDRRHVRWIAAAFVAGAALSVMYGAAKGGLGASTSVTNEVVDAGRFQGGAGDPNYLAAELVPAVMLAVTPPSAVGLALTCSCSSSASNAALLDDPAAE